MAAEPNELHADEREEARSARVEMTEAERTQGCRHRFARGAKACGLCGENPL